MVGTTCIKCGAEFFDGETYYCGSEHIEGTFDKQSERCKATSFLVRRRLSTILGILDACDPIEIISITQNLNANIDSIMQKAEVRLAKIP